MSEYTRFVVAKVALGQIFLRIIRYFLSISFHVCSILIIIYIFLLPERKTGEPWETSKKQRYFGKRGKLNRKVLSFFSLITVCSIQQTDSHMQIAVHINSRCTVVFTGTKQIPQTWRCCCMCGCAGIFQTWNSERRWEWLQHTKQTL
jgi:hypothetical protein